jgi:DNA-binding SARP family transcriptional activator/streptogramin lyase
LALRFCILGPLEVRDDGRELPLATGRQRALLALLLVHANELIPSKRLIEELWSGHQPPSAHKALQGYVSQLRRALPADTILTRGSGYVLVATESDAGEFERLTKRAAEQEADEAIVTLQRALALWRGRAFEEFEYENWTQLEITRLEELRLSATEQRIEAELELGHHAQLVPELEALVADHPLREQLRGQLMVALYRSGRHADALDVYSRGRQVLQNELGLEPSPLLTELQRQILSHDSSLTAPDFPPLNTERVRESRLARRRLVLAGIVAVIAAGVAAVAIAVGIGRGSGHAVLPNSLIRIDPKSLKATEVAQVGDAPDLVLESGGYLWVTNNILRDSSASGIRNAGDHTLTRVDPATGKTVTAGGGLAPYGLAADPSGDIWVANCFPTGSGQTSNVVRVDARTMKFNQTLLVPGGNNFFRGVVYGGGFLWLGDSDSAVTQVDPGTRAERRLRVPSSVGTGLAWSGAYGDLWVTSFDHGNLTRLHTPTGISQTILVGVNPVPPVVDGNVVWVGDWSVPHVVRLAAVGTPRPRSIALPVRHHARCVKLSCVWWVAAGAGFIWATTPEDGALWRIDPKTNTVTRVALPYRPAGVTADANNVWVTVRGKS